MTTIRRGMLRIWIVLSVLWTAFNIFADPHPAQNPLLFITLTAGPPIAAILAWLTVAWIIRGFARPDYSDQAAGRFRRLPNADYRRPQPRIATVVPDLHHLIETAPETAGRPAADRQG